MNAWAAAALGNAVRDVKVTVPVEPSLRVNGPLPPLAERFEIVIDVTVPLVTNVLFTSWLKYGASKFAALYAAPLSGSPPCEAISVAHPVVSVTLERTTV